MNVNKLQIPDAGILEKRLRETTSQIPPKFSAIHINGKRAYKLARNERNFEIPERKISVSEAKILDITPTSVKIQMIISSGGYIRSFAPIIGGWC